MRNAKPVEDGLFVWPSPYNEARLIASRCGQCGDLSFPRRRRCKNPSCMNPATEEVHLEGVGRLDSYTIQNIPLPPSIASGDPSAPIAMGLVEFPEGIMILGRLQAQDLSRIEVGSRARLGLTTLYTNAEGIDIVGWQFCVEGS